MHFPSFAATAFILFGLAPVLGAPIPAKSSSLCKPKRNAKPNGHNSDVLSDIFPTPTATVSDSGSDDTPTSIAPSSSVVSHKGKPTPSASQSKPAASSKATGTATATASDSEPSASDAPSSPASAPDSNGARFVIYTDSYVAGGNGLPKPSDLKGFNTLALSFLLASGPADQAQQFASLSDSERSSLLQEYHDAGIRVIVSAFGETESPTTKGDDAAATANTMAAWVKKYNLDGIDVDYEDFTAFDQQPDNAIKWLETFTKTLRAALPAGRYTVSHAPVAPWFTNDNYKGGYLAIDKSVGDMIDWYNVQFYNQGNSMYTDCTGLLTKAGATFPGTSIFEIADAGVPLNKLVIGKPATAADASNGFIEPDMLSTCVAQAQKKGWNAGVMTWEFPSAKASWISAVRGAVFPL